ncbi:MAG TPA: hypothetical protein VKX45_13255 [Bryobacteraceae bacterium]|nr:hypothetical protein [Bryobacteraceae bacterium]
MKKVMWIAALWSSALTAQNGRLANGIYAVEKGNTTAKNLVTRKYEGKDVLLDTAKFAPLVIEGKPEIQRGPRGSGLSVQLAPEAARRLAALTRSHIDRQIAVVIGDRVVSTPTVRSAITDGKAWITPCEDESCQTLRRELGK